MTTLYRRPLTAPMLFCLLLAAVTVASAQTFTVVEPTNFNVSPRLSDIGGGPPHLVGPTEIPHHALPVQANYQNGGKGDEEEGAPDTSSAGPDTALQTTFGPLVNATTGAGFDGLSVYQGGYIPSDSNIAVGPNHIVETVNEAYAVYNKTGGVVLGATSLRSLWTSLGGACSSQGGGDPIVQYDRVADRWIITQMGTLSSPYSECIAVSTSPDPTGSYYMYSYGFGSNLNDYPKFGVWSTATNSAYLASYNLFANGANFVGAQICAYDRAAMLSGAPSPLGLCYTGLTGHSFQPSDIDGATPIPDGTPAYFVNLASSSSLGVYKLTPNFATQTATLSPRSTISVASYSQAPAAVQPGTTRPLDPLSDRLMYRLAVRMFGSQASFVVNHSVTANSAAGVRWYELRADLSTSPNLSLFQQGTFAPDSNYRWMGSAAMDQAGDIAIGYSVSSNTVYPSIRYTGRTPADALGTMQSEASLRVGSGSQTGYDRWGDYTSLRIDPSDDCTFWYVNEYLPTTSSYGWYTNISSFKFSGCGGATVPDFSLSANPSSLTIQQGNVGTSTVSMTSIGGNSESVNVSVTDGCPANATCTLSSPTVSTGATSTVTITTTGSTQTGSTTLVITGTGTVTGKVHTVSIPVTVNSTPDFTINLSSSTLTVKRGTNGILTVQTGPSGGSGSIALSISGLPNRTSATFNPTSVPTGNPSTLTISALSSGPKGTFAVTVKGTKGGVTQSAPLTLTIN